MAVKDDILDFIKNGKQVRDAIGEVFEKNYIYDGKKLEDWRAEFEVPMHEDMNPQDVIACGAKISELSAEATFRFNIANSTCVTIEEDYKRRLDSQIDEIIASLKGTPKKDWPSVDAIKAQAAAPLTELRSILLNAQIVRDFWANLRDYLHGQRFNLQTINNSLINIRKIDEGQ